MTKSILVELFGGFMAACFALWFVALGRPSSRSAALAGLTAVVPAVRAYLQRPSLLASVGLLLLRLSVGGLMIHHGQEKLADPQQFANTYVASLHLPFPLFFAYAAGFSELIGSWLVILGLLTPVGALALSGTMTVAAYQHISTAGFNIYVCAGAGAALSRRQPHPALQRPRSLLLRCRHRAGVARRPQHGQSLRECFLLTGR